MRIYRPMVQRWSTRALPHGLENHLIAGYVEPVHDLLDRCTEFQVLKTVRVQRPVAPRPPRLPRAAGAGWRRGGSVGGAAGGILPPSLNAQSVSPCWERLKELPPAMMATYCWPFTS